MVLALDGLRNDVAAATSSSPSSPKLVVNDKQLQQLSSVRAAVVQRGMAIEATSDGRFARLATKRVEERAATTLELASATTATLSDALRAAGVAPHDAALVNAAKEAAAAALHAIACAHRLLLDDGERDGTVRVSDWAKLASIGYNCGACILLVAVRENYSTSHALALCLQVVRCSIRSDTPAP